MSNLLRIFSEEPLNLIVTPHEVKIETSLKVLKNQPLLQPDTRLEKIGRKAANPSPTMQMRLAPLKADILHVRSHSSPDGLGKFSELGE